MIDSTIDDTVYNLGSVHNTNNNSVMRFNHAAHHDGPLLIEKRY